MAAYRSRSRYRGSWDSSPSFHRIQGRKRTPTFRSAEGSTAAPQPEEPSTRTTPRPSKRGTLRHPSRATWRRVRDVSLDLSERTYAEVAEDAEPRGGRRLETAS